MDVGLRKRYVTLRRPVVSVAVYWTNKTGATRAIVFVYHNVAEYQQATEAAS